MKHLLHAILLLAFSATIASAQVRPYVRAGIGASRANGDGATWDGAVYLPNMYGPYNIVPAQLSGSLWRLVGNAGIGIEKPVGQQFVIRAEINLEQKGSVMEVNRGVGIGICGVVGCPLYLLSGTGTYKSTLTYLTLPILVGYRTKQFMLSAGPHLGYKIDERLQGTFQHEPRGYIYVIAVADPKYNTFDAGVTAEMSYALTSLLSVDLRYSQGLLRQAKPYTLYYEQNTGRQSEPAYHQTAQIAVRYNLRR